MIEEQTDLQIELRIAEKGLLERAHCGIRRLRSLVIEQLYSLTCFLRRELQIVLVEATIYVGVLIRFLVWILQGKERMGLAVAAFEEAEEVRYQEKLKP